MLQIIISIIFVFMLASCGRSQPSQFYLLNPLPAHNIKTIHLNDHPNIGLGPVHFPKYLRQPQIVTRETRCQLKLNEFHRWAEPLDDNVNQVILNNLSNSLHSCHIMTYPWRHSDNIDFQIRVDISQFDADEQGHVILAARWEIIDAKDNKMLSCQSRVYQHHLSPKYCYSDLACCMSQLLGRLSLDISRSLKISDV